MSYVAKGEKEYDATGAPVPGAKMHKIRITLTSSNVRNLEKCTPFRPCLQNENILIEKFSVSTDLINRAKDKELRVKGPVRLPTKVLRITTRKTVRFLHPLCRHLLECSHIIFNRSLVVRVLRPGIATSSKCTNVSST